MKVLFIYTDVSSAVGYTAAIGSLSAILKREGHETKLIHVSNELGYPLDLERINGDIREYGPDLICFSITTNQWFFARQIGRSVGEEFDIPIIVGGHHPTAAPEKVIAEPWVDMVCRGEGDKALVEVLERIADGSSMNGIRNIYHKDNGRIIREPLGTWIDDLDSLPFDDRDVFDYSKIVDTRSGWAEVIVTRGCPYPCTYCFNTPLIKEYGKDIASRDGAKFEKKIFINRRRSVGETIRMLKELTQTYQNITGITFVDDIMAREGEWFEEFSKRYSKEIGLPYACTSHPMLLSEKVAGMLKESGCKVVKMGVEAGNADIRRKVLKRNISNERLRDVFGVAKDLGLKPQAFNMIGIPGETLEDIMETARMNAEIKPYIVWVSTFVPYPGTELYMECERKGMIDESKWEIVDSYRGASVLKDEYLPSLDFEKIRVMFRWLLNANLKNEGSGIYEENLRELSSLPDDQWRAGEAERLFVERDAEIDRHLREKDISHYVSKKYINILWGREYNYDLT